MSDQCLPSAKPVDRELSRHAHLAVSAEPKGCWRNAILCLLHMPNPGVQYVEGWVVQGGLYFEHGWLETPDAVIEPTLTAPGETAYYAGVRYGKDEALRLAPSGALPIVARAGRFGLNDPGYLAAHNAASEAVRQKSTSSSI